MEIDFKSYRTWEIIGSIVAVIVFLFLLFPPSCSENYSDAGGSDSSYSNSSWSEGFYSRNYDGNIITYRLYPDGTFKETIRATNGGTLRGEGTFSVSGNDVILYGVSPLYGTTTIRIDMRDIEFR